MWTEGDKAASISQRHTGIYFLVGVGERIGKGKEPLTLYCLPLQNTEAFSLSQP